MRPCGTCPIWGTEYCHLVNPKAKKYTLSEKRAIREELDRKFEMGYKKGKLR